MAKRRKATKRKVKRVTKKSSIKTELKKRGLRLPHGYDVVLRKHK